MSGEAKAGVVRTYGVLAVGVAAVISGVLVFQFRPSATFGWTAYAPLSHTVVVPAVPYLTLSLVAAALLVLVGLGLIAGWIGFAAGRHRRK